MAKIIHLLNEEAFDRAYDRELAAVVDNAVPKLARLQQEAFERAIKQLVSEAWEAGAAWASRYPLTEEQRELLAGDITVGELMAKE
jgi:hypothetical protein